MARLRGVSFPFRKKSDGVPGSVNPLDLFKESIEQILLTRLGERVMHPNFGSNLKNFVFDNVDESLPDRIKFEVLRALDLWEPRISVTADGISIGITEDESELIVHVEFTALGKNASTDLKLTLRR